jgi:glutamate-ammonia-ligase adenylyltransferase
MKFPNRTELGLFTARPDRALEIAEACLTPARSSLDPVKCRALLAVLGNSDFLARWAKQYPERAATTLDGDLGRPWGDEDYLAELHHLQALNPDKPADFLISALLEFKYRHLFRISLRDIGLGRPFGEIAGEFSALARTILQAALDWHSQSLHAEFGVPRRRKDAAEIPFAALAMGKLGGNELNFSSDVDLIYFYGSDEGSSGKLGLGAHEYFTKLSERLSAFLQRKNSEGFLYRVDLELRPEGKAGSLTNSLDAMEDYYESFGAPWEKQAMIRASRGAGDAGLVAEFLRRIHPFVYPKLRDFSFLQDMKTMKEKIVQAVRSRPERGFNLKLGDGGIREVEFFTQALQLLFGGRDPELQIANTLEAMQRLGRAGLIEPQEESELSEAYVFLRTMEHRLQLVEEQQTHELPQDAEDLRGLARRMGYADPDADVAAERMLRNLELHRQRVQSRFEALLSNRFEEKP